MDDGRWSIFSDRGFTVLIRDEDGDLITIEGVN